ncbi:glycoside hydrolase [Haloprofundus halophilus]|uniref:glycoside hydrolase n=1 Tax=Haloprofundus halophilus TaxID=2283527 RepID=UPI000E430968|nr:glycoside hydrolase [Haloprofundus halophilus]
MASLTGVRGAIYFPARSHNHYQSWAAYDPRVAANDLDYAKRLNLNAVRVVLSYHWWRENRRAFADAFDDFLLRAENRGIRVLPVLFESIGEQPTNARRRPTGDAPALKSPSGATVRRPWRWDGPREFTRWVANRCTDPDVVLALEIMNEPGEYEPRVKFVREMLRVADRAAPAVPLTVGCKDVRLNTQFSDPELDVYQFHMNLPPTEQRARRKIRDAVTFARTHGKPVWLTEWQRLRRSPRSKLRPDYASLAPIIRESALDGDFFWQLMLKPAYMRKQREKGRINGLFHADGAVFSAADANALAKLPQSESRGDTVPESVEWTERQKPPKGFDAGGN